MKKLLLLTLTSFLWGFTSFASHVPGGNITYECTGNPNEYIITLTLYEDCGTAFASSANVSLIPSNDCGLANPTLSLTNTVYQQEVSQLCAIDIANSECNGGTLPGVYMHQWQTTVTLSGPCDSWTFGYSLCCMNTSTNVSGQPTFYVETTMNSATDPCNTSAVVTADPIPYVCAGQPVSWSPAVADADGDYLSFSLISAYNGSAGTVTYNAGYSGAVPIPGATIDPNTGLISFTPTTVGNYVFTILIEEFDASGNLIGTVVHEFQFEVINCTNNTPASPSSMTNFSGTATQAGPNSISICALGESFCFDVTFTDTDNLDVLTLTSNVTSILPGATFTQTGTNPATATICWTSQAGYTGDLITITAEDDACPTTGVASTVIDLQIAPPLNAQGATSYCGNGSALLSAIGAGPFTWSVVSGDPLILGTNFSCNPCTNPTASPTQTTTYQVTDGCGNTDQVTVTIDPSLGNATATVTTADQTICPGQCVNLAGTTLEDFSATSQQTFSVSPNDPLNSANSTSFSTVNVSGLNMTNITAGSIESVCINIDHVWTGDLDIYLVCPSGTILELSTDNGSSGDDYSGTCFTVNATQNITAGTPPYTGTYLPEGAGGLDAFVGCTANGNWQLQVTDDYPAGDDGTVLSWSITFNDATTGTGPATSFSWSPTTNMTGANTLNPTVCPTTTTTYTLTAYDQNGCFDTDDVTITVQSLNPLTVNGTDETCDGANDGSATTTASGGTAPYTYNWTPAPGTGQGTGSVGGLADGTYNVTATDNNGCQATGSVTINPGAIITAAIAPEATQCLTGNSFGFDGTGSTISVGTITSYSWNFGDGNTGTGSTATHSYGSSGTYTVTLIVSDGTCTDTETISVTVNPQPTVTANGTDLSCNGASDGTVSATASGSSGYTYNWVPGGAGQNLSGLGAGTYTVTVTDINGCTATDNVTINEPTAITSSIAGTDVSCAGAADGTATVTASGGTGTLTYTWVPAPGGGQGTANATGLTGGTAYTVTVEDANGCQVTETFTPVEPSAIVVTTSAMDANCGASDGSLSVDNITGGSTPYASTVWVDDATSNVVANPNAVPAGSYTVTVTDANGCTGTSTETVSGLAGPTLSLVSQTNASCSMVCNGSITVNATGGVGAITYNWSPAPGGGQGTATVTGLCGGTTYTVTADASGCTDVMNITVGTDPDPTAAIVIDQDAQCNGVCDGAATATMTGGTAGFTYVWSNGETNQQATALCVGAHTVTITDANGCTATANTNITEPTPLTLTITGTDALCNGSSDGSADATIGGGTAPYTTVWQHGPTSVDLTGVLAAGTYTLDVTDANGCIISASVTINQPAAITSSISGTDVSCAGAADGTATVTASGGTGTLSYNWVPAPAGGQGTVNATGLTGGTAYTVTITDANGCTTTETFTPLEPTAVTVATSTTNSNCGQADGSVTAVGSGGTGTLTYQWDDPGNSTTATVNGLLAGTYNVTVTDANGCTVTSSATISDNTSGNLASAQTDVTCNGGSDGGVNLTVTGGNAPFTYAWTGPAGFTAATEDINGLVAGTYNVTVTDAVGCVLTLSAIVSEPTIIVPSATGTDALCNGSSDGTVTGSATGGAGGYSYEWFSNAALTSSVGTGATLNTLTAGTYYLEVTDGNGCTQSTSVTIGEPAAIVPTVSSTDASCGQADGSLTFTGATGGSGVYNPEQWLDASNNPVANPGAVIAGTYTVVITDNNGCTGTATANVADLSGPNLVQNTALPASCNGVCDGAASVTASGGAGGYTFNWTPAPPTGQGTNAVSGLCAGNYTVTVTDANGCVENLTITITEPPVLNVTITSATDATVNGVADGTADASAAGGTPAYTYQWFVGCPATGAAIQTGPSATGLAAGDYTVLVTDAKGCTDEECVTINEPNGITTVVSSTDASCFGVCDGTVDVVASGGVGAFSYQWFASPANTPIPGATGSNQGSLCAGDYYVVVTDANGGTGTSNIVTVSEPTALSGVTSVISNYNGEDISCNGACDGSVDITASGGTPGYTYQWDNPGLSTGQVVNGLCAGTYNVTITDFNGCQEIVPVTLTEPAALSNINTVTDASCFGVCDGEIASNASGGVAPYSYQWDDPTLQTTATATALCDGTYNVLITDANGCTFNDGGTVTEPTELILSGSMTGSNCGQADGSASISVTQGDAPYSYQWNAAAGNQTTATATNLAAGCYDVTVTDGNGCTLVETVCVVDLGAPTINILTQTDVSCNGGSDGFVQVQVSGGTPGYVYEWFDGAGNSLGAPTGTPSYTGSAGNYTAEMTDANGCIATVSATINEPSALNGVISTSSDVTCFGDCDGSATVLASGGTPGYTYLWNDPSNQTNATANGLCPGSYTVIITDGNACTFNVQATIAEPLQLIATVTDVDAFCNTPSGSATVNMVQGGVGTLSYSWNPSGQGTQTAINLLPNTYTVTVTDADGCQTTATGTVGNIPPGTASINAFTDVSCFGGNDGTATGSIVGGTAPYTYEWYTSTGALIGQQTQIATGLSAGDYYVIVTDANTCQSQSNIITIGQPNDLAVQVTTNDAGCFNECTGFAEALPSGGTGPYSYQWDNALMEITPIAQGLCAQTYNVIVTDNNGCTETAQAIINEPTPIELDSTVTNANCQQPDGSGCVIASGGTGPYTYLWPNGSTNSCEANLLAGTYVVEVRDANDCVEYIAVEISDNNGPAAQIIAQSDALCFGANDGSATVDMIGGGGNNFTVLWDVNAGSQTTPTASNLTAGTYGVTITDNLGCSASTNVTIGEPDVLQHVLNTQDASCFSYCDGTAGVSVIGGTQPYNYTWLDNTGANVGNTATVTGLCAGNYVMNLTDVNGCPLTVNATINEPVQVTASATFTDVICNGACDGTATASGINGVAPFTYQWDDPNTQNTATATNLCPGTYTCTVTDADGCFTTVSVTISEPTILVASIPVSGNESCSGFCDGFAQADAVGGVGGYTYSWNNGAGNTQIVTNLCANTYTVTVTDANGCTDDEFVVISTPNPLAATMNSTNVSCYNACDGTAGINVSGGTTPYAYQWDNPAFSTTANITGLCAGTWTVTVTDANGCTISQSVTITQPNELTLTGTITDANCGQSNGSIAISPVGGVGPFVYQWSNQSSTTSATMSNEPAGCYTITILDANACSFDSLMCINDIVGPTVSTVNSQDVTCNGDMDGFVEFNSVGGTAPVTFELFNSSNVSVNTGQLLTNNLSGDCYTLVATDAAGCISTDVLCVNEPNALNSAVTSSSDVSCYLGNDGQATVSSSGGIQPHTYNWSTNPVQTTATATGLTQGTYNVTTTDNNGCTHQSTVTINQPTQLVLTETLHQDVSCNGGADGALEITATGGTLPYVYNWNPNVSTNPLASGLSAGSYTATVTDGNGCVEALGSTITEPQSLALSVTTVNSTCTLCNGEATVTATGGTAPYTYNWLNGGTATTAVTNTGMCPGAHSVTVTDANGCTATIQLTIIDEPSPTINGFNMTEPLCHGLTNGSAQVLVSGGTVANNYSFQWGANAFNQVSQTALALPAGNYCVTVSDDNGCTDFDCVTVTQPAPLVPVPDIEATICYGDSTQIWASAAGGTAPYTVNWLTAGLNGPGPISVDPLLTETYCFTITDANGCLSNDTCGTVTVLPALNLVTSGDDAICDGESITISATASGGNGGPYTINWVDEYGQAYNGTMTGNTSDLTVTPVIDTWYYAYLSDGCSLDTLDSLQIIVNPNPISFLNVADPEGCEPFDAQFILNTDIGVTFEYDFDCDGTVDYSGSNPNPMHTYTGAGTYDVCVNTISADGCSTMVSEPGMITVHPQPVADFIPDPINTTFLTPTINMTNLSVGATNYHWNFGDGDTISGTAGNIPAGTNNGYTFGTFENPSHTYQDTGYFTITLTITTDFGCTDQVSYQVYIEGDYVIYVPNAFTPDNDGLNDVFIPEGIGISDEEYSLYIYNRWGEVVFESHNKNIGWDGKDKTGNQKVDVYVWLVRTKDHKGQEHEYVGHVTLIK